MDFQDKVVIVTGSSSGIGAAIARNFAKLSARVVITGRNEAKLAEVADQCHRARGIKPLVVKAEITDDSNVERIVEETVKAFGRIDVLVNNAGGVVRAGILDGVKPFDQMIALLLRSAYLLTSLATPYLIKSKGNIINISSTNSIRGSPRNNIPYNVAKAGLNMLTMSLAADLAMYGVRANTVIPSCIRTNVQSTICKSEKEIEEFIQERVERYPLGKIATADEVAEMVIFLASDKAKCITGSNYLVDNGKLLL